jgi:hypothetical protein
MSAAQIFTNWDMRYYPDPRNKTSPGYRGSFRAFTGRQNPLKIGKKDVLFEKHLKERRN